MIHLLWLQFTPDQEDDMFSIYLTNFGYIANENLHSLEAAIEWGKSRGFEFSVLKDKVTVAYWSMFGGTVIYRG
jgi:hypothetical protein